MKQIKIFSLVLALLLLCLAGIAVAGWVWYQAFLQTPIEPAALSEASVRTGEIAVPVTGPMGDSETAPQAETTQSAQSRVFDIPVGATLEQVAMRLEREGLISSALGFQLLAYLSRQENAIKAGEYALTPEMTPPELLVHFTSGRALQFPFTIIPGSNFQQVLEDLAASEIFVNDLEGLDPTQQRARIGLDDSHPEGWFFPDTYHFDRGTKASQILNRAYRRMQDVLDEEWQARTPDLPLASAYEALILASIIEKETGQGGERARIAGVFVRRLNMGMRLQTDPTVIYGLGPDFDGDLRRADLKQPTDYNTYVISGLPPTPIALPSREAIHAALHPADGRALYFVARNDGTHHFSATLAQHNCAVRHYQRNRPCAELKETSP